ncbi:sigma-70 family RNA polymerase sigma factor [Christensenellaceae bacterium OttesenSCG-928-L17]|nr:sigma-70 family RNA polymerase sigma factor [Christensenellaceae bacterium OttesenSCG-928-L17]
MAQNEHADSVQATPGETTLETLYETHAKTVYWAAFKVVHNREAAADIMQNVFLRAHKHLATLTDMNEAQCRAWLYRTAVNAAIDTIRREKHTLPMEDMGVLPADNAAGPEEAAERNELRERVREALDTLPEKYKEALTLYYFAELDYKQISALLNTSEGTLKARMSRGRALMEKALRKGGGIQ